MYDDLCAKAADPQDERAVALQEQIYRHIENEKRLERRVSELEQAMEKAVVSLRGYFDSPPSCNPH